MTSSAISATPPDVREGIVSALAEVGELNFFGFVDPVAPEAFQELADQAVPWICAEVDFRGVDDGLLRVAVPAALACELLESFSGEPDASANQAAVDDLLGEFANMICGSWLTRARPDSVFALGRPAVTRMHEGWRPAAGDGGVLATFNDRPVAVWLKRV